MANMLADMVTDMVAVILSDFHSVSVPEPSDAKRRFGSQHEGGHGDWWPIWWPPKYFLTELLENKPFFS